MAETTDDNIFLFDYIVYATETRFQKGLDTEIPAKVAEFKNNDDVLIVRIMGDSRVVTAHEDYIMIESPEIPELNIEFCAAKNISFMGSSLPTRTFLKMARDLITKATIVYLILLIFIAFLIFLPCGICGTKSLLRLIRIYKAESTTKDEIDK